MSRNESTTLPPRSKIVLSFICHIQGTGPMQTNVFRGYDQRAVQQIYKTQKTQTITFKYNTLIKTGHRNGRVTQNTNEQ